MTIRIGVIADTHGLFRPAIAELFAGVDFIVHAGDVGGGGVLDALSAIAPTEAVSGNVDDRFDPRLPRERMLPAAGLTLHVSHGDELGRPTPEGLLARYAGDIVVFGHTHRPVSVTSRDGRLVVNPGSAGPRRFSLPIGVARLTIDDRAASVELITIDERRG